MPGNVRDSIPEEDFYHLVGFLIWPTVAYGTYPAFVDYAGSISLSAPVFEAPARPLSSRRLPSAKDHR